MSQRDRRELGISTVSYAILLPIFFLLLFGGYEVWRVVAVKQGLNRATYMATRSLGRLLTGTNASDLRTQARDMILESLTRGDPFINRQFAELGGVSRFLNVTVNMDPVANLPAEDDSALFEIRAELQLPWLVRLPLFGGKRLSLSAIHIGGFTHTRFGRDMKGTKPVDPERQGWFVSPWPTPTSTPLLNRRQ